MSGRAGLTWWAMAAMAAMGLTGATARPATAADAGDECQVRAPKVEFEDEPRWIDLNRAGGEPVSVVAQDGSISVSAHAGTTHVYKSLDAVGGATDFAVGYTNQTLNWRSTDGGKHWQYIGLAGQPFGPHSPTSTGFSDPDFAMDLGGNIYNTEIDLANDAVFKSTDDGQSYPIANPVAAVGDRPWLTALEENEVFLYVNLPKGMFKATDPALAAFTPLPTPPVTSKSLPDPLNPQDGMIGPVGLGSFAISGDDAQTWKTYRFGPEGEGGGRNILGRSTQFFGVIGVDRAGNVYQAAAGGYGGPSDVTPNGEVTFTYYERATGKTNQQRINIPIPEGDALWPWIVAGDDGRVAVVWYQNHAGSPREFYAYAAVTNNGHGTITCADGTTRDAEPQFTVVKASGRPVHIGNICLSGTTCNLTTGDGGDRRLGDFFTVNYDLKGNLFIVSADTTRAPAFGGTKPVGNPIVIRQKDGPAGGDRLLERPISPRQARCLWPLPSCSTKQRGSGRKSTRRASRGS